LLGIDDKPEGGSGDASGACDKPEGDSGDASGACDKPEGDSGDASGACDKPEGGGGDASGACSGDANEESLDELLPEQERSAPSIRCPNCNRPMTCTQFSYRPSWKLVMAQVKRGERPEWFEP